MWRVFVCQQALDRTLFSQLYFCGLKLLKIWRHLYFYAPPSISHPEVSSSCITLRGHPKSLKTTWFDRGHTISYYCSIVTGFSIAPFLRYGDLLVENHTCRLFATSLSPERQSAETSKITNDGLTQSGTGWFSAVPIWQQWASKKYRPMLETSCMHSVSMGSLFLISKAIHAVFFAIHCQRTADDIDHCVSSDCMLNNTPHLIWRDYSQNTGPSSAFEKWSGHVEPKGCRMGVCRDLPEEKFDSLFPEAIS